VCLNKIGTIMSRELIVLTVHHCHKPSSFKYSSGLNSSSRRLKYLIFFYVLKILEHGCKNVKLF
jgi:hypothetical protein